MLFSSLCLSFFFWSLILNCGSFDHQSRSPPIEVVLNQAQIRVVTTFGEEIAAGPDILLGILVDSETTGPNDKTTQEGELFCVDIGGSNSVVLCQRRFDFFRVVFWFLLYEDLCFSSRCRLENGNVNYKCWTEWLERQDTAKNRSWPAEFLPAPKKQACRMSFCSLKTHLWADRPLREKHFPLKIGPNIVEFWIELRSIEVDQNQHHQGSSGNRRSSPGRHRGLWHDKRPKMVLTYSEHTVNIQWTYSEHTANIYEHLKQTMLRLRFFGVKKGPGYFVSRLCSKELPGVDLTELEAKAKRLEEEQRFRSDLTGEALTIWTKRANKTQG